MPDPEQQSEIRELTTASRRMLALREAVFAHWERMVCGALDEARKLSHPILVDTLPRFYDDIARSLTPAYPRASGVDGNTTAAEHGNERARMTGYDHQALIVEYQLLRRAILEVLDAEGVRLEPGEVMVINTSIDGAIEQAVAAFSLVHAAMRERFAAALTHDLRGPLGAVSTALELIAMTDDPARVHAIAARGLDNARRMQAMIEELLQTMAFHGGGRLELDLRLVDLARVVEEVRSDAAARGVTVEVAGASLQGWWDREALKRALENMVGNAHKYGAEGAPIRIGVAEVHGRLVLSVHNDGAPIPVEEQGAIFEMYRRAGAASVTRRQGWGIGLPYVRAVAESHGGSVVVDSAEQRGTTFTIDIPLDCRPLAGAAAVA